MLRASWRFLALLFFASAGCDAFLVPQTDPGLPDDALVLVHVGPNAPPLEATEVSFWIVRGVQTVVEIRYLGTGGYNGKCLRLVIPADSPLRDARGRPIAPGDSVHATVRVLDPELFLFELLPAGLTLNPASPAWLEVRYWWKADDVNGDGVVDGADQRVTERFRIWGQDLETHRWSSVPSARLPEIQEIHGPITRFTRYALASD